VVFNNGLSAALPDMVEGLTMPAFEPYPIRKDLSGAPVITPGIDAITLPHLAGEWKGSGKDMTEAETQAAYDGACMVYARNKALDKMDMSDPPNQAFVATFTTDGTLLNIFLHYASISYDQVKYHSYLVSSVGGSRTSVPFLWKYY
jgi:hypothetical protein